MEIKKKKSVSVDEKEQILWYVYDITDSKIVDYMANGIMAESYARIRAENMDHEVLVGFLFK